MPDRTRGRAPVATSGTVSWGDVVALGMGCIVSGASRSAGPGDPRAALTPPPQDNRLAAPEPAWQGAAMSDHGAVPTLTDGVVTLRAHREDDATGVLEQSVDPASVRWTTVPVPYGVEDARRFVLEVMPEGWAAGRWGFAVESGGR